MTGLKICTRCRAISARRSRRINSSLLPENIGPTITSIQPMLPLTMSTVAAASCCYASTFGCGNSGANSMQPAYSDARLLPGAGREFPRLRSNTPHGFAGEASHRMASRIAVERGVEEGSKSVDHGDAEGVLAGDQVPRQHAPGALGVAYALAARVGINRRGQLRAAVEHLDRERCGDQDAARLAEGTAPGAVGDVGPVFQEHQPLPVYLPDVKAALEPDEVPPPRIAPTVHVHQRLSALPRPGHQLDASRRRAANAAFDLHAHN